LVSAQGGILSRESWQLAIVNNAFLLVNFYVVAWTGRMGSAHAATVPICVILLQRPGAQIHKFVWPVTKTNLCRSDKDFFIKTGMSHDRDCRCDLRSLHVLPTCRLACQSLVDLFFRLLDERNFHHPASFSLFTKHFMRLNLRVDMEERAW